MNEVCFRIVGLAVAVGAALSAWANAEPIRPGVPEKTPFWNAHAHAFIRPPAFDFPSAAGAAGYRFTVDGASFVADVPWAPLTPVWTNLAPGYVTVRCEALDADGRVLRTVGERRTYRAAPFRPPYPPAAADYVVCARRVYEGLFRQPHVQAWLVSDGPPAGYDLYCYPSKILSAMAFGLVRYARLAPADRERALAIARRMLDWLIAESQPADAPLAHLPPTYWGDRRGEAVANAGVNMMIYPAQATVGYFALYDATGETKYRDAALRIAETYRKLQNARGSWPLKVRERDGAPLCSNLVLARTSFDLLFERAAKETGDASFLACNERLRQAMLDGAYRQWNWEGQFEDQAPTEPYRNLEMHVPAELALWFFKRGRTKEAFELVDWCEDQFVVWSDPIDLKQPGAGAWWCPTALEQYNYYTPIDGSMAKMILAFDAACRAGGGDVYREKARALADCLTRHVRPDGLIPTYFDGRPGVWINCAVLSAYALETFAAEADRVPTR